MAKRAAILRWTGRGEASDLLSSVNHVLKVRRVKVGVVAVGGSIVVTGAEPTRICSIFENMPGVAWTATGFWAPAGSGVTGVASTLAANYLKRGMSFSVLADATGRSSSDVAGAVTSAILERVKGARATNGTPRVKFRAAVEGGKGVVGVEYSTGPGGCPMGESEVICLVSGGRHSSVVAWNAVLQGFRVHLVHAATGEESLVAVASLYAELSNRSDPRGLCLTALDGGPPGALLSGFIEGREPVYGGFTVGRPAPAVLGGKAVGPLFMLSEESFESQFKGLGIKSDSGVAAWGSGGTGGFSAKTFRGKLADVSGVLDGLA